MARRLLSALVLCAAGCLDTVYAGIVAMEGGWGLAPSYRRAVESGQVRLHEHA